jgi:hypothetical protein
MSTGDFLNPEKVLNPPIFGNYERTSCSDSVVTVASTDDFGNITITGED